MSCRLFREESSRQVVPLFGASLEVETAEPNADGGSDAAPPDEAVGLRIQLLELQSSLEANAREAYAKGLREGEALGVNKAAAASQPIFDRLAAAAAELASLRPRIREETEAELISLSVAVARRVLHRELSIDPDAIQGLVRAAFDKVQIREVTRIRLHPSHAEPVRKSLASLHASAVEVVSDASLSPGDVRLETSRGNLEASVDTQLAEIERGFADRIGR